MNRDPQRFEAERDKVWSENGSLNSYQTFKKKCPGEFRTYPLQLLMRVINPLAALRIRMKDH